MIPVDDPQGAESELEDGEIPSEEEEDREIELAGELGSGGDGTEDFEVTGPDIRRPSTMGISFCVRLHEGGQVILSLPAERSFPWQPTDSAPFQLNGRYESCKRRWTDEQGRSLENPMWRRHPALLPETEVVIDQHELSHGHPIRRDLTMPQNSPIALRIEIFPRRRQQEENAWLLTVVLRNSPPITGTREPHESVLYQTYFVVTAMGGELQKYPESERPLI